MKREETVDYNIKATWHAISKMYNSYGSPFDITASTGFVLLNIDVENGTPATKIAPLLGMESRSLTRMLKTFEEKGWISKVPDPNDGRSVRIFLTPLGEEKRELSRQSVKTFNKKVRDNVSDKDMRTFFDVLYSINKVIDDKNIFKELENHIQNEENH
ncbi:MAG: MarR family transcriptional regulator [bacterium]|nr:MarR family transcriptional regulator [bacterium]